MARVSIPSHKVILLKILKNHKNAILHKNEEVQPIKKFAGGRDRRGMEPLAQRPLPLPFLKARNLPETKEERSVNNQFSSVEQKDTVDSTGPWLSGFFIRYGANKQLLEV